MTGPRNATTTARGRTYKWRDETFDSVTTILGRGVPKGALPNWAAKTVAEYAAKNLAKIQAIARDDPAAAIDLMKGAPWRDRDKAAAKGSDVHAAVEAHTLGRPMPDWPKDVAPSMGMFEKFLAQYTPTFEMSEATVYSRTHHYAGTLDGIAVFPTLPGSPRLLFDLKTGNGVYGEVALQLAAYRYADFIGLPDGSEVVVPEVDGCAVLHLRPQSYTLIPVIADESIFRFFLYAHQVAHYCDDVSKGVLLAPYGTDGDSPFVTAGVLEQVAEGRIPPGEVA